MNTSELHQFDPSECFLIVGAIGLNTYELEGGEIVRLRSPADKDGPKPDYFEPVTILATLDEEAFSVHFAAVPDSAFGATIGQIKAFQDALGNGWQPWASLDGSGERLYIRFEAVTESNQDQLKEGLEAAVKRMRDAHAEIRFLDEAMA
jgi:cold shock CspA family protein